MESVRELATVEGISVTKLVENVLEQHVQQETTGNVADKSISYRTIEPELKQPRGVDGNLLRELLLELLFDRGVHREVPQSKSHEMQELKERVKNLERMVRADLKENP